MAFLTTSASTYAPALTLLAALIFFAHYTTAWNPDPSPNRFIKYGDDQSDQFSSDGSAKNFFRLLDKANYSILIGARNRIYNLSLYDLKENVKQGIEWRSTPAHQELCVLKGKSLEVDCQNYVRIAARSADGKTIVCGTNSYKPLCRHYHPKDGGRLENHEEFDGSALCPYDPEHNSTAIYTKGQLYTATVADFSGTDPLIYRGQQRTERFNLRQLNNPSFVSSVTRGDYVYFFYRETAVEYMNCGKAVYSRVARVCLKDKGGPRQFGDRWTSFLKARLNCSIHGEYPFYFDEIQSTTDIVSGIYGRGGSQDDIIYGVLTTPVNSIGGSAVCAFAMRDILNAFRGEFKSQETINANWLPLEPEKVPNPRPGECVNDSRTLPDVSVNFIKTHALMEKAVPAFLSKPLLVRVSLQYRFTTIAVHPQVMAVNGIRYDVLYIGTDDGRIIKTLNAASALGDFNTTANEETRSPVQTIVVSETQILRVGVPVKQLHVAVHTEKLIVISNDIIKTMPLFHCSNMSSCGECLALQDPHCAWDSINRHCVSLVTRYSPKPGRYLQDIEKGSDSTCVKKSVSYNEDFIVRQPTHGTVSGTAKKPIDLDMEKNIADNDVFSEPERSNDIPNNIDFVETSGQDSLKVPSEHATNMIYTAQSMYTAVSAACLVTMLLGFVLGYLFSRRFRHPFLSDTRPFHEQHNRLNSRLTPLETPLNANSSVYLQPRANKTINLVVNVPAKQDNLQHELGGKDRSHECKNSNESLDKDIKCGTLQKVKKTYI